MVWPVHCVQESPGSEFPPEFSGVNRIDDIVYKGSIPDREYYSAFQDIWGIDKTQLAAQLKAKDITDVFIVGLALDYCVFNSAMDSASLGWKTHIIQEGTKPVDPGAWDSTLRKLEAKGVNVIDVDSPLVSQVKALKT